MGDYAWVTLATNNSYSLGALVLAHSLKKANTAHKLVVLITPAVSESMREQLQTVFDVVKMVDVLDSKDEAHLALMKRPDLGITFTKIHCWRLVEFKKCVFLDADTLVVRNCDELFDREEFSAAPDISWPDCFNSGVFVYRPSIDTFNKLLQFAVENRSFDGGDQGLLNQFFSDWATEDIKKHLPFVYNLTSIAAYSYIPAFKHYGSETRIVHFIGTGKPWLQQLDATTRTVTPTSGSEHLAPLLQQWWDLFCEKVHPNLDKNLESNGMPQPPVEACSNSIAIALTDESQTSRLTEPCTPYREKDDFRQYNLPYQPFDVKGSSGELLNVEFLLAAAAPQETRKENEERDVEEEKWEEQPRNEETTNDRIQQTTNTEEVIKTEEPIEERKVEEGAHNQEEEPPPPPKDPFDYITFFPDETCISNYLEQNVVTYQPFENHQESMQEKEQEAPSLPRFLTIPQDDLRQSGNTNLQEEVTPKSEPPPSQRCDPPPKESTPPRQEPIEEKRELAKSKSMSFLPTETPPPRSIWKSQPNVNIDPNRRYSMPKLRPILPKQSFSKSIPSAMPKVTLYTEFLMSSEYKDPVDLPKDEVGFVEMHIHRAAKLRRCKSDADIRSKFGPLPYAHSPEVEKPIIQKKFPPRHLENELYDLAQCKRQMGNKPKPKNSDRKENIRPLPALKPIAPSKDKKIKKRKSKELSPGVGGREKIPKREPKIARERRKETKPTPRNVSTKGNTLDEILQRLREFSKDYQHFFGVSGEQKGKAVVCRNTAVQTNEESGGESKTSEAFETVSKAVSLKSRETQTGKQDAEFRQFRSYVKDKRETSQKGLLGIQDILLGSERKLENGIVRNEAPTARREGDTVQKHSTGMDDGGVRTVKTTCEISAEPNSKVQTPVLVSYEEREKNSILDRSRTDYNSAIPTAEVSNSNPNQEEFDRIVETPAAHQLEANERNSTEGNPIAQVCNRTVRNTTEEQEKNSNTGNVPSQKENNSADQNPTAEGLIEIELKSKSIDDIPSQEDRNPIAGELDEREKSLNSNEDIPVRANCSKITPNEENPQTVSESETGPELPNLADSNDTISETRQGNPQTDSPEPTERDSVDSIQTPDSSKLLGEKCSHLLESNNVGEIPITSNKLVTNPQQETAEPPKILEKTDSNAVSETPENFNNSNGRHDPSEAVVGAESVNSTELDRNELTDQQERNSELDSTTEFKTPSDEPQTVEPVFAAVSVTTAGSSPITQNGHKPEKPQKGLQQRKKEKLTNGIYKLKNPNEILCVPDFDTPRSSRVTFPTAETATTTEQNGHDVKRLDNSPDGTLRFVGKRKSGRKSPSSPKASIPPCGNPQTGSFEDLKRGSGIAGAIAQLSLDAGSQTPESAAASAAHQEYLRRQNWETGNMDYMGRDSFDNIWSKICQTLESKESETAAGESPKETTTGEKKQESTPEGSVSLSTILQKCPEYIETLPGDPAAGPVEDDEIIFSKPDNRQQCLTNIAEVEEGSDKAEKVKLSDILQPGIAVGIVPVTARDEEVKCEPEMSKKVEDTAVLPLEGKVQPPVVPAAEQGLSPAVKEVQLPVPAAPAVQEAQTPVAQQVQPPVSPAAEQVQPPVSPAAEQVQPLVSPAVEQIHPPVVPTAEQVQPPVSVSPTAQKTETSVAPTAQEVPANLVPVTPEKEVVQSPVPMTPTEQKTQTPVVPPAEPLMTPTAEKPQPPEAPIAEKIQTTTPTTHDLQPTSVSAEGKPKECTTVAIPSPLTVQLPTPEKKPTECTTVAIPSPPIVIPGAPGAKKPEQKQEVVSEPIPLPPPDSPTEEPTAQSTAPETVKEEPKQKKGVFTKILEMVGVAPKEKNDSEMTKSVFYDVEGGGEVEQATEVKSEEKKSEEKTADKVEVEVKPEEGQMPMPKPARSSAEGKKFSNAPSPKLTMPQTPPETAITMPTPPPNPEVPPRKNSGLLKVDEAILETPPVTGESAIEVAKGKVEEIIGKAKTEVENLLQDRRSSEKEVGESTDLINTMKLMMGAEEPPKTEEVEELRVTTEEERERHKGEVVTSKLSDQILKAIPPPRRKAISEASASTSAIPKAPTPEQKTPPAGEGKPKPTKPSSIPVPPPRNKGKPSQPSPPKGKGKK